MAPLDNILSPLGIGRSSTHDALSPASARILPLYSPIAASEASLARVSTSEASSDTLEDEQQQPLHAAQRRAKAGKSTGAACEASTPRFALPTLTRFLADFTLGFADGLTVPFALTAGLSSLGQTDTVIYAGMAEICAGSISMGIGGYLSAKGERAAAEEKRAAGLGGELSDTDKGDRDPEKVDGDEAPSSATLSGYLAPLELPPQLLELVVAHVQRQPGIEEALAFRAREDDQSSHEENSHRACSPVMVWLSVSLGYLLGGLLPLFPYFFVSRVGDGLLWSFAVCVLALFLFGFTKDFFLNRASQQHAEGRWSSRRKGAMPWKDIRRSAWEGAQMVILGSVAALAAVLCVRAFEGMSVATSQAG